MSKACSSKVRFRTTGKACAALLSLYEKESKVDPDSAIRLTFYRCAECGDFHLGHQKAPNGFFVRRITGETKDQVRIRVEGTREASRDYGEALRAWENEGGRLRGY